MITLSLKIGETKGIINICIHLVIGDLPKINTKYWFTTIGKEKQPEDKERITKHIEKTSIHVKGFLGKSLLLEDFVNLQLRM